MIYFAGQVLDQLSGMGRRSSEQLELGELTSKFRKGFNQMKDRLEVPAAKSFREVNPTGSNRRQATRPFPWIAISAIIATGLAVDLALIVNAGGIPGVSFPGIPGITPITESKVNKVANKVVAVAEVIDDLAGDEEEYIVEDEASGDYGGDDYTTGEDILPTLPVLGSTDEGSSFDRNTNFHFFYPETKVDEASVEDDLAAVEEEKSVDLAEDTKATEEKAEEEEPEASDEKEGTDTRSEDEEVIEKEGRFHKFDDEDKEEFLDAGQWFNVE